MRSFIHQQRLFGPAARRSIADNAETIPEWRAMAEKLRDSSDHAPIHDMPLWRVLLIPSRGYFAMWKYNLSKQKADVSEYRWIPHCVCSLSLVGLLR